MFALLLLESQKGSYQNRTTMRSNGVCCMQEFGSDGVDSAFAFG
jgi:hypothetical protein